MLKNRRFFMVEVYEECNTDFVNIISYISYGGLRPIGTIEKDEKTAIIYIPIDDHEDTSRWFAGLKEQGAFEKLKEKGLDLIEADRGENGTFIIKRA